MNCKEWMMMILIAEVKTITLTKIFKTIIITTTTITLTPTPTLIKTSFNRTARICQSSHRANW